MGECGSGGRISVGGCGVSGTNALDFREKDFGQSPARREGWRR